MGCKLQIDTLNNNSHRSFFRNYGGNVLFHSVLRLTLFFILMGRNIYNYKIAISFHSSEALVSYITKWHHKPLDYNMNDLHKNFNLTSVTSM
jgi:hypothetical protein